MHSSFSKNNTVDVSSVDELNDAQLTGISLNDLSVLDKGLNDNFSNNNLNSDNISVKGLFDDLYEMGLLSTPDNIASVDTVTAIGSTNKTGGSHHLAAFDAVEKTFNEIETQNLANDDAEECNMAYVTGFDLSVFEQLPFSNHPHNTNEKSKETSKNKDVMKYFLNRGVKRRHDDAEEQSIEESYGGKEHDTTPVCEDSFPECKNLSPTNQEYDTCDKYEENSPSDKGNKDDLQDCLKYTESTELLSSLCNYHYTNIHRQKSEGSIYENVVKKIDIDEKKLLSKVILKELSNKIEVRGFDKTHIDISLTYSNIRKRILDKISPRIKNIMLVADVPITPGMSILDIKRNYVSNVIFFDKLRECCKEIAKEENKLWGDNFLNMIQRRIKFDSGNVIETNMLRISSKRRDRISALLKSLIVDAILNLPNNIKSEIEKLSQDDIIENVFVLLHGVYLTKSFVRNVINIHMAYLLIDDVKESLDLNNLIIKAKLEEELRLSVILFKGVTFSPDKYMLKLMSKYLMLDISKEQYKLLKNENRSSDEVISISQDLRKRINDIKDKKSGVDSSPAVISGTDEFEQLLLDSKKKDEFQSKVLYETAEKTKLVSKIYKPTDICYSELTVSIYENAIKKIDIDEEGLFRKIILKEFNNSIEIKRFDRSSADISRTYSNMRKYILCKISPYISNIMRVADITITPGMSIQDVNRKYIHNQVFFNKLYSCCVKIAKNISKSWSGEFLSLIQSCIRFGQGNNLYTNIPKIAGRKRNRISMSSKYLVMDTICKLPKKIKSEMEKFDSIDILGGAFTSIHGAYVTKSFIRDVIKIYIKDVLMVDVESGDTKIDDSIIKMKLEESFRSSVVLIEGVTFSTNEHAAKLMSSHLLLDMSSVSVDSRRKLLIRDKTIDLAQHSLLPLDADSSEEPFEEDAVETDRLYQQVASTSQQHNSSETLVKSASIVEQSGNLQNSAERLEAEQLELASKSYIRNNNIYHTKITTGIYENAIKKINVDEKGFLMDAIIKEFSDGIKSKGFDESSANISWTYLNIRKYILDKTSPYINDIMSTSDIIIAPGMSISDIRRRCVSNQIFFDKLHQHCKEIAKIIYGIRDEEFLLVQKYIHFNSGEYLGTYIKSIARERRDRISKLLKSLIVDIISNLPQKIKYVIEKLDSVDIIKGVFVHIHGKCVPRSFIRKIVNLYPVSVISKLLTEDGSLKIDASIITDKIEEEFLSSVVLYKGIAFSPKDSMVNLVASHLLSDMITISSEIRSELSRNSKKLE